MKIVQISDCHLFSDSSKLGYNDINPVLSLKQVLTEVELQRPEVLLITGDISGDGSGKSYRHFARLLQEAQIDCQIGIIPGNHDDQTQLRSNVPETYLWSSQPRLILDNHWHIHLLDTQHFQSKGLMSEDDLEALDKYLGLHPKSKHLLAVHHHPISCNGWMDNHQWTNRNLFNRIVAQHSAVKGVIYGHIHTAITQQRKHCLYMACPATCWQFANQATFAVSDLPPGYRVLNLLANGQIDTSIHRV